MFNRKPTLLDIVTDNALIELNQLQVGTPEYAKTLDLVIELHGLKDKTKSPSVSKDTLAVVAGNLLGILMVIKHENVNVITSRAMNLLIKPR